MALPKSIPPVSLFILTLILLPISAQAQRILADPGTLYFSASAAGPAPRVQAVRVTLNTAGTAPYAVTIESGAWLRVDRTAGETPDILSVRVDATGLAAGLYVGSIGITTDGSALFIPVNLYVRDPLAEIIASPSVLLFSGAAGGPPPPAKIFTVRHVRSLKEPYFAFSSGESWLNVITVTGLTTSNVEVRVNQAGLADGTHTAAVVVLDGLRRIAAVVHVTLFVTGGSPLTVTPESMSFQAQAGVDDVQSRNLFLYSFLADPTIYEAKAATNSGGAWLSVTPTAGVTNTILAVTVNAVGLPVGAYAGSVTITTPQRAVVVPVTLNVTGGPAIRLSTNRLEFQAGGGLAPPPQTFFVDSISGSPLTFSATTDVDWLVLDPGTATTVAGVQVTASAAGLTQGIHHGLITVKAAGSEVAAIIQVTLNVTDITTIEAAPASLTFTAEEGASAPRAQTVAILSSGAPLAFTLAATTTADWLMVAPVSGTTPASVEVAADPSGLSRGEYGAEIVITAPGAGNTPVSVPVSLKVEEAIPHIVAIVHGASLAAGVLAPGTNITIFGRRLGPSTGVGLQIGPDGRVTRQLAGVRVLFDGIPSALTYVQAMQANVVVPYAMDGRNAAEVVVEYQGVRSRPVLVQLVEASPGIFTADSSGRGPGAILNEDHRLNTTQDPAPLGSVVSVYATGGGQTSPPGVDGQVSGGSPPIPLLPVRAWVGPLEATVEYAGGAPGLISSVLQINVRIPAGLAPGNYPITIQVGRFKSQLGVMVSVR